MAKVSFSNEAQAIDVEATVVTADSGSTPVSAAVEPAKEIPAAAAPINTEQTSPPTQLANHPSQVAVYSSPLGFDDDNIGFEDLILPRINLVQKVGDLSNVFTPGEIVLDKSLVIYTPPIAEKKIEGTGPLTITVLGFRKRQFAEKTDGKTRGMLLNSEQDVVKNGGTLDYREWEHSKTAGAKPLKLFERLATAVVLIECPKGADLEHISFPHECDGKFYALAVWSMKGSAYTDGAKAIFTDYRMGHLKRQYSRHAYALGTRLKGFPSGNFAHIPVLTPGPKNGESFLKFIRDICGGTVNQA